MSVICGYITVHKKNCFVWSYIKSMLEVTRAEKMCCVVDSTLHPYSIVIVHILT